MLIDDEMAANVENQDDVEQSPIDEQPTSPVETVDQTKAFAARLKEEKAKAKLEAKEEIAKQFGFSSWEEYSSSQTQNKLLDRGLDPDSVLPVIKDLIKEDPDYQKAMEYKAREEELEKELFATNSLKALNDKFGTNYNSINELDSDTVNMWNAGTPLEKAYAANNWDKIRDAAVKKASSIDNGKSHMVPISGGNVKSDTRELTKEQLKAFEAIGGFTKEQVMEYYKKHQE